MNPETVRQLFARINVWKRGDERAPHKPLLLLYALAKCRNGAAREIPFREVDRELGRLLIEFGPTRKSHHTEYPFWRLRNDGLWELSDVESLERRRGSTDAKKSELLNRNPGGGFTKQVFEVLRSEPSLILQIAKDVLDRSFPDSIHGDILSAVGLDAEPLEGRTRDPRFRARVLTAYEHRCAICGFDVRVGTVSIGLEAAHIKWHQAGGSNLESNGLALCVIHHKMFDRGAFAITTQLQLIASEQVNGYGGLDEWLLSFHGKRIRSALNPGYMPDPENLAWHRKQVFHAPARHPFGEI